MKILKVFLVDFNNKIDGLEKKVYKCENIISIINNSTEVNGRLTYVLMTEKSNIRYKVEANNITINLSKKIIESLEEVSEDFINLISLSNNTSRKISTPKPSIFLIPENSIDIKNLAIVKNMNFENLSNIASARTVYKFDLDFCLKNLDDRLDGVQILVEANSSEHLSGKFHEYMRFFERAFRKENRGLIEPLSIFLKRAKNLGYSKAEIEKWIFKRNMSVHANHRDGFLIERDIIKFIDRLEQACYDILFNKIEWGNKSTRRRDLHKFRVGSESEMNNLFAPTSETVDIILSFLDETKSYPQNFQFNISNSVPKNWWFQKDEKSIFKDFYRVKKID